MSRIRAAHTKPEVELRKELSSRGLRGYRIHRTLPGKPDITFGRARIVVFVDGCFWHGCPVCGDGHLPKSNQSYWMKKIAGNRDRDMRRSAELRRDGWLVLRFWEHDVLKATAKCAAKIERAVRQRLDRERPSGRPR